MQLINNLRNRILTTVRNMTGYLFCLYLSIVQMSGLKQENTMRRSPACCRITSKTWKGKASHVNIYLKDSCNLYFSKPIYT